MNKQLKQINQEQVLFFDLEDVRRSKDLDIDSREFELFRKKTRNKETDEYLPNDEVIKEYLKKGALKMGYTKIVSIGVGFIKDGQVHIKALEGDEESIIKQFCTIAQSFNYVCGANILAFDLPMLVNNGYRYFDVCEVLPDRFITSGKKVWNLDKVVDTQEVFKGTHYYASSLDEVCYHFDLPSPKSDLDGSQVSDEYWENGLEKINRYVKQDVFACINVFKKMRFEHPFETFIDKNEVSTEQPIVEELSILKRLYVQKDLTEENKKELSELLKRKKLVKKDKEKLLDLVSASIADIDVNFGKVKNQSQIDGIINQLRKELQQTF